MAISMQALREVQDKNISKILHQIAQTAIDGYYYRFIGYGNNYPPRSTKLVDALEGFGYRSAERFCDINDDPYYDSSLDKKTLVHYTRENKNTITPVETNSPAIFASMMLFDRTSHDYLKLVDDLKEAFKKSRFDFAKVYTATAVHDYSVDVYFLATTSTYPVLWMPNILKDWYNKPDKSFYVLGDFDDNFYQHFIKLDNSISDKDIEIEMHTAILKLQKHMKQMVNATSFAIECGTQLAGDLNDSIRIMPPVVLKPETLIYGTIANGNEEEYDVENFKDNYPAFDLWMKHHKDIAEYLSSLIEGD